MKETSKLVININQTIIRKTQKNSEYGLVAKRNSLFRVDHHIGGRGRGDGWRRIEESH